MTKKWEELTEKFNAKSEDGRIFHILVYTTMIGATNMSNPNTPPIQGLKAARTSEGYPVCQTEEEDTFKILAPTGEIIVHRVR